MYAKQALQLPAAGLEHKEPAGASTASVREAGAGAAEGVRSGECAGDSVENPFFPEAHCAGMSAVTDAPLKDVVQRNCHT